MPPLPSKKNDQIFQLTLTELAFMLIFLLMLLTGWMVVEANRKASEATEKLKEAERKLKPIADELQAKQVDKNRLELLETANKAAQAQLDTLKIRGHSPDSALVELQRCSVLDPENRDLKLRLTELEKQLVAPAAFLEAMKALARKDTPQAVAKELETAMAFRKSFEDAAGRPLDGAGAAKQGWECVTALARNDAWARERQDLINQLTFMRLKMESIGDTKGFGPPPCWADNGGKSQRLLAIEVTDQGLLVRPGWPAERAEDAKMLPNIKALVGGGKALSIAEFKVAARPILDWGKARNPECRLYASVTVSATRVDMSVAGQNAVFDHFFPYGRVALQKSPR